jgi:tetratricopeptide (TPR) repeat protein
MNMKVLATGVMLAALAGVGIFTLWLTGRAEPQPGPSEDIQLRQTITQMEERVRNAQSERDAARRQVARLQLEISALADAREEDRRVIQDLWAMATAEARRDQAKRVTDVNVAEAIEEADPNTPQQGQQEDAGYGAEAIKEMLAASGGDLGSVVRRLATPEAIRRMLEKYGDRPACWAAAASLAPDPETALAYLEEAAKLYPDSPAILSALVGAQMAAGRMDESTLAYVRELQNADPTNALGDCYAAHCQFETGDIAGALQSLSQAGVKGRFADDRIEMLMERYDCLLDEGASDAVALGLSAFTLPLEHLGMVRQMGQQSIEQAQALSAGGQIEDALRIAQDVTNVGKTVSSSGRFLLHDRVGIALQQAGLTEQQKIYTTLGDTQGMETVGTQLQAVQERSATIDTMIQGFGAVMPSMTEEDWAGYVDSTILNGEFATLQNIPEIAQALSQSQPAPEETALP